ncbi:DEKNAAC100688 [Brettanomyces naardenensis]|uniref:DEKNAAC100688 n=1 Tax=Brettanomyces naardenensis TaxID=13370 RepID=A0A448YEM9_BRENA|nr:DEKNAAC100688 [Brettanomyces naardenensis]
MPEHYTTEKEPTKIEGAKAPYPVFYTWGTPNGLKVTILAELLGIDYYVYPVDISKNIQKEPWYLNFNANGRIPSLGYVEKDGSVTYVNESAAILLFLTDKYDKERKFSFEPGTSLYYEELEWLFFQMAGLGPMKGQFHWFSRNAPKDELAINRYYNETFRLIGVLEERLKKNGTGYLVSDHITIADIVSVPWLRNNGLGTYEQDIKKYTNVFAWIQRVLKIPAVQRGLKVPK